ncbi:hypothetical protein CMV_013737 [Castanea mollissima]|uniref:Uncharacterized protein n=1 Tax=Castanea mollissima TaxID=60419 RepID=A0A8J4QYX3_9ROSI|nr:hypothetical protein CMV_013737 [Castanea mollissima]
MLNAKEESLNEGMEIKDPTFAMAVNTTPRPSNNNGYNSYNQSSNEVKAEETTIENLSISHIDFGHRDSALQRQE